MSAAGTNRRHVFLGHLNCRPLIDVEEHIADEDLLAQLSGAVFHQVLDLVASDIPTLQVPLETTGTAAAIFA